MLFFLFNAKKRPIRTHMMKNMKLDESGVLKEKSVFLVKIKASAKDVEE